MKKNSSTRITLLLSVFGMILVIGAVILTVFQSVRQNKTAADNRAIVEKLLTVMPPVHTGERDDRVDMNMPMLEMDGENFIGILEIPLYGKQLPVCGSWSRYKVSAFPCRYYGNLYDGSLIIGGSDMVGQFDFLRTVSIGDSVLLTDMTGGRYLYTVQWVHRTSDVSAENLMSDTADLVLFARNSYSLDYSVMQCSLQIPRHTSTPN